MKSKKSKPVVLTLICAFIYSLCFSQTYNFNYLTAEEGLSQSEVTCFLQDRYGFIWIGTLDGLNKYDGYNIQTFNTDRNNKNSLTNNTIRALKEDKQGRIWIGTDDGLCMYNPVLEVIEKIPLHHSSGKNHIINSLLVDNDLLYMSTNNGLKAINLKTNQFHDDDKMIKIIPFSLGQKNNNYAVEKIIKSHDGSFWILESNSISKVILKDHTAHIIDSKKVTLNDFSGFKNFCEDHLGNVWMASTNHGVFRYAPKSKNITNFMSGNNSQSLSSNWCSDIVVDNENNIWISTIDKGLNKIQTSQLNNNQVLFNRFSSTTNNQYGINSNLLLSLYVSRDNLLWIGTIGKGVNFFNPNQKQIKNYTIPNLSADATTSSNFIRAIYGKNNRIWIGTHNNGLYVLDKTIEAYRKLGFENQSIFHINKFDQNKLFICGNNGISLVSIKNNEFKIIDTFKGPATFNIKKGTNYYWGATLKGIIKLKIDHNKISIIDSITTKTYPSISLDNCRVLYFQKDKNIIWVGTEGGGLNEMQLDSNEVVIDIVHHKKKTSTSSLSNNYVRSIYEDVNGFIWIGTYEGINKLIDNDGEAIFETFTKSDGLPNNMIQSIEGQDGSSLWIGTNKGLSNLDLKTQTFRNFTQSDGLQSNEFSEHTSFKTQKGEFLFGGINGISAFFPEKMTDSKIRPKTKITEFYLFNNLIKVKDTINRRVILKKSILATDTILLAAKQNNFKLNFSAMHVVNPYKINYAYKLDGYDKEWIYTDANNRTASYTNLNNGMYTFKVKSTNSDGIWEPKGDVLFIKIQTPFYKTWWAYFIYSGLFVLALIYWTNFSVIKITTKKKIILESEHNKKLHNLDELRTKFFINVSHDLRTPLTLISGPIENLLEKNQLSPIVKTQLNLVKLNVDRLKYLTEQLLDIRKIESNKYKINVKEVNIFDFATTEIHHFQLLAENKGLYLRINTRSKKIIAYFDVDVMSKIFFNILSNSFKFTETGGITISINTISTVRKTKTNSNQKLDLIIEFVDTGIGIPEKHLPFIFDRFHNIDSKIGKGYNIGLSHCKDLIETAGGEIKIKSIMNEGTNITIILPNSIDQDMNLKALNMMDNNQKS